MPLLHLPSARGRLSTQAACRACLVSSLSRRSLGWESRVGRLPWRRRWTDERDPAGRRCPWRGRQLRTDVESRRTTAEFQRSPLCASTPGPLVSVEWTLGCWRERLRGVLVVGPGTSAPIRPTWPLSRVPVAPTQRRPARPRDGLLHEGGGVLARGCAYCTKARPTWSTHESPPVAPRPRVLRPGDAGSHLGDHVRTLPAERAAALAPGKPVPPVS